MSQKRKAVVADLEVEFWHHFWDGDFEKNGKRRYIEYYDLVRSLVPEEKLLEYKMGEGWGPLCEFLDAPLPEGKQFPRTNDTDGFVARCKRRNRMQMLNVAFRGMLLGGGIAAMLISTAFVTKRIWSLIRR